jgi:hypothetical protein
MHYPIFAVDLSSRLLQVCLNMVTSPPPPTLCNSKGPSAAASAWSPISQMWSFSMAVFALIAFLVNKGKFQCSNQVFIFPSTNIGKSPQSSFPPHFAHQSSRSVTLPPSVSKNLSPTYPGISKGMSHLKKSTKICTTKR